MSVISFILTWFVAPVIFIIFSYFAVALMSARMIMNNGSQTSKILLEFINNPQDWHPTPRRNVFIHNSKLMIISEDGIHVKDEGKEIYDGYSINSLDCIPFNSTHKMFFNEAKIKYRERINNNILKNISTSILPPEPDKKTDKSTHLTKDIIKKVRNFGLF